MCVLNDTGASVYCVVVSCYDVVMDYDALCWFQTNLPLTALPRDHRLLFQSCSSQWPCRFGFITERHRSQDEYNSTVCDLPRWAKRQGYRSIGKTLLAAWSSICDKWRLSSCTNIIIKAG